MINKELFIKGDTLSIEDFKQKLNNNCFSYYLNVENNKYAIMKYDNGDSAEELKITYIENENTVEVKEVDYREFISSELVVTSLISKGNKMMVFILLVCSIYMIYKLKLQGYTVKDVLTTLWNTR